MPREAPIADARQRTCRACAWTTYPARPPAPIERGRPRWELRAEWRVPERCERCGAALPAEAAT